MIRLTSVGKTYDDGASWVVHDVSLEVPAGKTLVLLGASGSGKSTVLKMVNRLVVPDRGRVELDGRDVSDVETTELRRSIGYVFQKIGLFPHMTVEENVGLNLRLAGRPAAERRRRTRDLLELVELPPDRYAGRFPAELSGGQQQRVGVARALALEPRVLLMDEPFGALDAVTREHLQAALKSLRSRLGFTIVFVTHDIFEALSLGDLVAVMRAGVLEQVGDREALVRAPATPFVRQLFRRPAETLGLLPEDADA